MLLPSELVPFLVVILIMVTLLLWGVAMLNSKIKTAQATATAAKFYAYVAAQGGKVPERKEIKQIFTPNELKSLDEQGIL